MALKGQPSIRLSPRSKTAAFVSVCAHDLVSRNNHVYKSFRELRDSMRQLGCRAVLDGEIVSLDETGRPRFYDLFAAPGMAGVLRIRHPLA